MSDRYIVIMAGGRGERFWPESRLKRPKHLLPIVGDKAMLRQTLDRLGDIVPAANTFIITNVEQEEAIREMCQDLPEENVVSEPIGRDTAPAVGLAAVLVKQKNPDATFAILPADHVIHDEKSLQECMNNGFQIAEKTSSLVTIGIDPTHPATGYGYIHRGEVLEGFGGKGAYRVQRFVEKPDLQTATQYLESKEYFWNAGMFVWTVDSILEELEKYNPELYGGLEQIGDRLASGEGLQSVLKEVYPELEKISIDFSVMEKSERVVTLKSTFDWDDVGEWPAIERHSEKDEAGNLVSGLGVVHSGSNNLVYNSGDKVTALLGVDDLIVVHTADATLVCHKDKAQEIKKVVKELGASETLSRFV